MIVKGESEMAGLLVSASSVEQASAEKEATALKKTL